MISHILKLVDVLATSYWFIPSLMALGAFLAAGYLTQSDWVMAMESDRDLASTLRFQAEGARTVMATVAGSMITVAGVTFSITISSIVHATTQFGPRLLVNFMNDRGNQITLGTFIATFLYCLIVLSTIPGDARGGEYIVPSIAVLFGVGSAIASVGVLIYFVHHVPASIQASNVISSVGKQLIMKAEALYAESSQERESDTAVLEAKQRPDDAGQLAQIRSPFTGYVQFLDVDTLTELATQQDVLLVLNVKPGDFVNTGDFLAWTTATSLDEQFTADVCAAFLYGDQRTAAQDLLFLANELVEIAARALSPGITDPFTAMMCMDWLGSSISVLADRHPAQALRYDQAGTLRMIVPVLSPSEYIQDTLGKLLPYACKDRNAALHLQAMLGRLMITSAPSEMLPVFAELVEELQTRAISHIEFSDRDLLIERYAVIKSISTEVTENAKIYNSHRWLCRGV